MDFDGFFAAAEASYGLQAGVLRAIAITESRLNPWACRFEPAFYQNYIAGKQLPGLFPMGVSESTERYCRAMSWGLLQVMGETAREMGFVGQFLCQLTDPETGIEWGAKVLKSKLLKWPTLADAVSAYNAGSPSDLNRDTYVNPILARVSA